MSGHAVHTVKRTAGDLSAADANSLIQAPSRALPELLLCSSFYLTYGISWHSLSLCANLSLLLEAITKKGQTDNFIELVRDCSGFLRQSKEIQIKLTLRMIVSIAVMG